MSLDNSFLPARVVGIFGAYYIIKDLNNGEEFLSRLRGKLRLNSHRDKNTATRNFLAIGDEVFYSLLPKNNFSQEHIGKKKSAKEKSLAPQKQSVQAVIEKVVTRINVFERMDTKRKQILASNIDCVILILSWNQPNFNSGFADRVLAEAFINELPVLLIINKADLSAGLEMQEKKDIQEKIETYSKLPLEVFSESLTLGLSLPLQNFLETTTWKRFLLVGQSGCGKSTFLNRVCQKQLAVTADIGVSGKGRHTTTNPTLYRWQEKEIIDIPGIREFGLMHHPAEEIVKGFPEMSNAVCRFENCRHLEEPDCQVKEKVKEGSIAFFRYHSYKNIVNDLQQNFKPRRGDYRLQ